jgi:hypothetical protein
MPLTSHDRQGEDFQGTRFLTGAARMVRMEVIDLNGSSIYRSSVASVKAATLQGREC